MSLRHILVLSFLLGYSALVAAANSDSISTSITSLNNQIQQINQELSSKQQKQQQIDNLLKSSQSAINKSASLLKKLQEQRSADAAQLARLATTLPALTQATEQAKTNANLALIKIYQQLRRLHNESGSLLSGNSGLKDERHKVYLVALLQLQQQRYNELSSKLNNLQELNQRLQNELTRLDRQLGFTHQQHQQLLQDQDKTKQQALAVKQQIAQEKNKLSHLRQKQAKLNKLLQQLAQTEAREQAQARKRARDDAARRQREPNQPATSSAPATTKPALAIDNSPFFGRKLTKPVVGPIAIGFGQLRDSVRNTGILIDAADNTPVYAVSNGNVLFSGELPGFGQIVVIDHGDNYTSVYSGIIAKVTKGDHVNGGQLIANSGNDDNQPMGGVYFELRHLGQPINPTKLFK